MNLFKAFFWRYADSPFVRNVSKLTGATLFGQLISLGTAPILYRVYHKEHYGTLGIFMGIAGVIGAFSTMQYTQAVIIEKEDHDALSALWLVRIINVLIASLTMIVIFFTANWLSKFLKDDQLANYLFLLPFSIFFSGQNELFRIWANRHKKYTIMMVNGMLTSVLVPLVSISLGLMYDSPMGLFIGLLSSQVIPSLFMWWQLSREFSFGWMPPKIEEIKRIALRHISFPKYSLPSEFINRFSNQLPTFMLSLYSGPAAVAAYNLSVRMLSLPIQLLSSSVGEVFRQRAAEDYIKDGNCRLVFAKTFKSLLALSVFPTVLILLFGPQLFVFFFGKQWSDAGFYSQILAGLYFIRFTASPLSYVFVIAGKQKEDFLWHIWMLASSFAAFYFGFYFYSSNIAAITIFAANYFLIYSIYLYKTFLYSKNEA